jgi:PAS domain S-box-containing protein
MESAEDLKLRIEELEIRLAESEQLIEAIKSGEVDAFALNNGSESEVYTLQSGDYAYRVLIEKFSEGALNLTEEGLIVYTNTYFCDLIKQPYEKVIGASVIDFVHLDSRQKFRQLFSEALKGNSKGEVKLQVKKKGIPVYISLTSLQPKLATVGVVITDLSRQKKNEEMILQYQKDLESKNLELLQINAELASFAYVASHDLQEPLRKIKTFTARILDKENGSFSEEIRNYFNRIVGAAKRMQDLIEALLNYSRTNTSELSYVPTNLNLLVDEVKNNLRELMEEKGAVVESSMLPTLHVIPFQFQQLFLNIIGNAIKYMRAEHPPVIKISAQIVPVSEIEKDPAFQKRDYWKIQISDNGIGFDQKYADKIFELFQRLHGKSEYEGTGIGLAICKKIVQNHGGFIKAMGEPGVGSTFNIYLPVN